MRKALTQGERKQLEKLEATEERSDIEQRTLDGLKLRREKYGDRPPAILADILRIPADW